MDDQEAFSIMRDGGYRRDMWGIIRPPSPEHYETSEETEAINYLCDTYQYQFSKE